MAPPVPQDEPIEAVAGDTWTWSKVLADYPPADGWTLGYAIRGKSALPTGKVGVTTSGDAYTVTILPADTKLLQPGTYQWQSFVDNATTGEHYTVDQGVLTVVAQLANVAAGDAVSHAETMLSRIQSEIEARVTGTGSAHTSYAINGRSLAKLAMKELVELRNYYAAEVARERSPRAASRSRAVVFGRVR